MCRGDGQMARSCRVARFGLVGHTYVVLHFAGIYLQYFGGSTCPRQRQSHFFIARQGYSRMTIAPIEGARALITFGLPCGAAVVTQPATTISPKHSMQERWKPESDYRIRHHVTNFASLWPSRNQQYLSASCTDLTFGAMSPQCTRPGDSDL